LTREHEVGQPEPVPADPPVPYVPFDGRPHRLTLGLRRLDLAHWLEVDEHRDDELAQKQALLAARHHDVVAHVPAGTEAAAETLTLVQLWLAEHRPDLHRDADPRLHPIDAAGRLVQEDLCVMVRQPDGWTLAAASVCFPSRWRLADKIGRTTEQIHVPVPDYASISGPVDAALDRLTEQRPLWRLNWTLLSDPALFQQPDGRAASQYPGLDGLTLRVERQTLRQLPASGAVLFTIRTHRSSLDRALAAPGAASALARTVRTMNPAHEAYKGWTGWLAPLVADLERADTRGPAAADGTAEGVTVGSPAERARP
jgi:hypothetical protein